MRLCAGRDSATGGDFEGESEFCDCSEPEPAWGYGGSLPVGFLGDTVHLYKRKAAELFFPFLLWWYRFKLPASMLT
jgi:hypothetical protein